jgi:hypothetical protein
MAEPTVHVSARIPASASAGRDRSLKVEQGAGDLFHPAIDLMMAGGLSIIVAVALALVQDKSRALPTTTLVALVLSHVINFPHFAHSYQLLYTGIGRRIFGPATPRKVRLKYIWAGFVAPSLLAGFLIGAYLLGDVQTLGYSVNAMLFFVGWHYVKQGYGVLMVLSAIKRIYYTDAEKKLLLLNGYVVWISSWLALNEAFREEMFFGVKYLTFGVPHWLLVSGLAAAGATTLSICLAVGHRVLVRQQPIAWSGVVGYGCALYLWLFAYIDPIYAVLAPMFHSLQYLSFVWRYQLNKLHAEPSPTFQSPWARFAAFVCFGILLGWLGFIAIPHVLQVSLRPDTNRWGPSLFAFMFAIWINIHHYFIDNVIWRRDNDDVRRFLFAPR